MNKERVLQVIDNLKGSLETMDYGKWGALNVEFTIMYRENYERQEQEEQFKRFMDMWE